MVYLSNVLLCTRKEKMAFYNIALLVLVHIENNLSFCSHFSSKMS